MNSKIGLLGTRYIIQHVFQKLEKVIVDHHGEGKRINGSVYKSCLPDGSVITVTVGILNDVKYLITTVGLTKLGVRDLNFEYQVGADAGVFRKALESLGNLPHEIFRAFVNDIDFNPSDYGLSGTRDDQGDIFISLPSKYFNLLEVRSQKQDRYKNDVAKLREALSTILVRTALPRLGTYIEDAIARGFNQDAENITKPLLNYRPNHYLTVNIYLGMDDLGYLNLFVTGLHRRDMYPVPADYETRRTWYPLINEIILSKFKDVHTENVLVALAEVYKRSCNDLGEFKTSPHDSVRGTLCIDQSILPWSLEFDRTLQY